jgi:hypothetical protein
VALELHDNDGMRDIDVRLDIFSITDWEEIVIVFEIFSVSYSNLKYVYKSNTLLGEYTQSLFASPFYYNSKINYFELFKLKNL